MKVFVQAVAALTVTEAAINTKKAIVKLTAQ